MTELERLAKLKAQIEENQRRADRAQGALDQALAQLRQDYGCKGLKGAKKLLARLERQTAKAKAQFVRELQAFEEQYGAQL